MRKQLNIFWFRRDLRLNDNAGLYHALKDRNPVLPIFIFDTNILDTLEDKNDCRVEFIHNEISSIHQQLSEFGSGIKVFQGRPEKIFKELLEEYSIEKVFTNHDYEKYAIDRDEQVRKILNDSSASLHTYKDQVIFEKNEVMKDDGTPYIVFTPYGRKWKTTLNNFYLNSYPNSKYFSNFFKDKKLKIPFLKSLGFEKGNIEFPSRKISVTALKNYGRDRNFPGLDSTSRLGIHLRFGTVSIRELVRKAMKNSEVYLNELIWREFYQMILWQFPHINKEEAFRKEFDRLEWRNNEKEFQLWCEGKTGYPMVDAGMRQLNLTGYMHNRVRMVTASFLAKHLLIDWRWGEAYFARRLLDFDFASNNGGWQWSVGSGCDAAPYFRIFNPSIQVKKFDLQLKYIKRWIPEFGTSEYPLPVVAHDFARKRCLAVYSKALEQR